MAERQKGIAWRNVFLGKRKGLAASASADPSPSMVATARNHRNPPASPSRQTSCESRSALILSVSFPSTAMHGKVSLMQYLEMWDDGTPIAMKT